MFSLITDTLYSIFGLYLFILFSSHLYELYIVFIFNLFYNKHIPIYRLIKHRKWSYVLLQVFWNMNRLELRVLILSFGPSFFGLIVCGKIQFWSSKGSSIECVQHQLSFNYQRNPTNQRDESWLGEKRWISQRQS